MACIYGITLRYSVSHSSTTNHDLFIIPRCTDVVAQPTFTTPRDQWNGSGEGAWWHIADILATDHARGGGEASPPCQRWRPDHHHLGFRYLRNLRLSLPERTGRVLLRHLVLCRDLSKKNLKECNRWRNRNPFSSRIRRGSLYRKPLCFKAIHIRLQRRCGSWIVRPIHARQNSHRRRCQRYGRRGLHVFVCRHRTIQIMPSVSSVRSRLFQRLPVVIDYWCSFYFQGRFWWEGGFFGFKQQNPQGRNYAGMMNLRKRTDDEGEL